MWRALIAQIRAEMLQRQAHPAHTVVLLPYEQLIQPARAAWLEAAVGDAFFVPEFATTQTWAAKLGGFAGGANDLGLHPGRDALIAANLLAREGLGQHQQLLGQRLVQAARSLAAPASAVAPAVRLAWGARLRDAVTAGQEAPIFSFEVVLAQLALDWAMHASYATDRLFAAQPEFLVVLEGLQPDPLIATLRQHWGARVLRLKLGDALPAPGQVALHQAQDAEDEAQRAAACVLTHLAAGRSPVGLVAQDRLLTRRVLALLAPHGLAVRDETGWKLSTTRAAAGFMSLLLAMARQASADSVLDWLKHASVFPAQQVQALEQNLRRTGLGSWQAAPSNDPLVRTVHAWRAQLQAERTLTEWLTCTRAVLQMAGQWDGLTRDRAGAQLLRVLGLSEGAAQDFSEFKQRMGLSTFTQWVRQTLEELRFLPAHPAHAQVLVLPLKQLLGRSLAAVVLPGCDEGNLPTLPEPSDLWSAAQRKILGLPTREELAQSAQSAWAGALRFAQVDVLWRSSENGEPVMPSALVQAWRLQTAGVLAGDPRRVRLVPSQATPPPQPSAALLPIQRLSASAYEDLRRCPYRFFALRLLQLQSADELDLALQKRDFGNWLHVVLKHFHENLAQHPLASLAERVPLIDQAADWAAQTLGLSAEEFLPFAAAWPRLREGYLAWLQDHEANGAQFLQAECWREVPLGGFSLVGKIDRIDRLQNGLQLVLDYKTEAPTTTAQRIKQPLEDTQLAFYAALLGNTPLAAAYVNVDEKNRTHCYPQVHIEALRDLLVLHVQEDMARIAQAHPMPALGEGAACAFCQARGLCRKDFWSLAP